MWGDGYLHPNRGWSGNRSRHPWLRRLSSCYHSVPYHGNWISRLRDLQKSAYGDNPRVCDYYLPRGIQTVPELDTHHSARVLDNNWARGLCRLWVVGKRGRAWVIEFIGSHAFSGCKGLKKITLGESLTMIPDATFQGCCSLTGINIPASVGFIGAAAFQDCDSLEYISICGPLTRISRDTFKGCESLGHMVIPESVEFIGSHAFSGCYSLEQITLGESLTIFPMRLSKIAVHWPESLFLPRLVLSEQLPSRTAIRWRTS